MRRCHEQRRPELRGRYGREDWTRLKIRRAEEEVGTGRADGRYDLQVVQMEWGFGEVAATEA